MTKVQLRYIVCRLVHDRGWQVVGDIGIAALADEYRVRVVVPNDPRHHLLHIRPLASREALFDHVSDELDRVEADVNHGRLN